MRSLRSGSQFWAKEEGGNVEGVGLDLQSTLRKRRKVQWGTHQLPTSEKNHSKLDVMEQQGTSIVISRKNRWAKDAVGAKRSIRRCLIG